MEISGSININKKAYKFDVALVLLLFCAAILRFYHLGFQSAWLDEVHTIKESDPAWSFSELHNVIMFREGIPHFYFLTIRFLFTLFGSSITLARMVSAIAGILTVLFIYLLGKELHSKKAGYWAALFLTFNVFHIEYSQEARSYALLALFATVAFYFLMRFIKQVNLKNALLLGLFSGLITNAQPIGIVNAVSIYTILFIVILSTEANARKKILKYSIISGLVALVVFSPVILSILKISSRTNAWILPPSYNSISAVFIFLSGNSKVILIALLLFIVFLLFLSVKMVFKKEKKQLLNNQLLLACLVLLIWIGVEVSGIIIKSYTSDSIILHRYFIGILPAMMLVLAIGVSLIQNKIISYIAAVGILGLFIFNLFSPTNYYTTYTKAQYDKVCEEIEKSNPHKDKVFSSWGWLMSYYLDRDNSQQLVTEMDLPTYISEVRSNAMAMESFWYLDGNSKPFNVSPQDQAFLDSNYTLKEDIEKYDAWARHYVYEKQPQKGDGLNLYLNQFMPYNKDGSGNLMIFESLPVKSPQINLKKGKYELTINGNSLPAQPIQGTNAHMIVKVNDQVIANYFLSEKTDNKEKKIPFDWNSDAPARITLFFDNDIAVNGLDRNVVIYSLKLKEQK